MGLTLSQEKNTFRDCILKGLKDYGIEFSQNKQNGSSATRESDLALIMRPFELPVDISYGIRSMYHGYPYHVGILYNGMVYNYMPDIDKLLDMKLGPGIHVDTLQEFCKEAHKYGNRCEIYYINNTGRVRSEIIARLIWMLNIKNGSRTLEEFNKIYKTTLSQYYNLFLNNCEHFAMTILTGVNFSCQEELVDQDMCTYKDMLLGFEPKMPKYGRIWINEYYSHSKNFCKK